MTAKLFTLPKQVPLSNSGLLIPGAKAYFYVNGTSTFQNTYTALDLVTPHTNPVVADGNGKFPAIYLDTSLQYKVKLTDASDVELYSEDDFTSPFDWGWIQTSLELANGITPVDTTYLPGDVLRYNAQIDGTTDDTTAFQNAIDSGHPAFCEVSGTANIEGTLTLDGDKQLRLCGGLSLERQGGGSTAPVLHVYGQNNVFNGNGATIRQDLYSHTKGIILLGPDPAETVGGTTDVNCYRNRFYDFKIVGPKQTIAQDGSPGIYIHSLKRRGVGSGYTNANYYSEFYSIHVVNCDVGIEFSTDANAHSFHGCYINQFQEAAIIFNGAYGNTLYGVKIEIPLPITGLGSTYRYAIHFLQQNGSTIETDTEDGGEYGIEAAHQNYINGYSELPAVTDTYVALMTTDESGLTLGTDDFGFNRLHIEGNLVGGVGTDGFSTAASIGHNEVLTDAVERRYGTGILDSHGWVTARLDDDSGGVTYKDSVAYLSDRVADMAESFTYDLFSVDNVGITSASVLIEFTYQGKDGTNQDHVGGKVVWMCPVTASTQREPVVISRDQADFGGEIPFVPICTEAAGTTANTGKFTVSIATQAVAGVGDSFCSWEAKLVSSNVLDGTTTNLDWRGDLNYLTSSSAGLVTDTEWKSLTKHKTADKSIDTNTTVEDDDHLAAWNVKADQYYKVTGHLRYFQNIGDFKYLFQFSQTPQEFSMSTTGQQEGATAANGLDLYHSVSTTEVAHTSFTDALEVGLSVSGFFRSNATTGGTVDFQWAQNTSNANATIVREGSWLTIERL